LENGGVIAIVGIFALGLIYVLYSKFGGGYDWRNS
jgi:hypothetical protein